MVCMRRKSPVSVTLYIFCLVMLVAACGKRMSVVTYDKKRGTTRHNTYKTPQKKTATSTPKSTIATKSATGNASKVIQTAKSYLGTPYRYGGVNRAGIDCSGLLCTSFESIGVKIPRSSDQQAEFGKEVSLAEIVPGDMVFFGERKGSRKVTHAGLVTAVRNKEEIIFIHSSTSRGVIEDNLLSSYYQSLFVKAVRPL